MLRAEIEDSFLKIQNELLEIGDGFNFFLNTLNGIKSKL